MFRYFFLNCEKKKKKKKKGLLLKYGIHDFQYSTEILLILIVMDEDFNHGYI